MITDPRELTAKEWCDEMVDEFSDIGEIPFLESEDQWREWAVALIRFPQITAFSPPDPNFFEDWQEWAIRFIQCVVR